MSNHPVDRQSPVGNVTVSRRDCGTTDPLAYLSASRLKSFLTCRLKFYYEKVLGLPSPSSPNLQIGKAVHAGLEAFHRAQWQGNPMSPADAIQAYQDA